MRLAFLSCALVATLAIASCAAQGSREVASPQSPLVGEWRSACTPFGRNGRHGAVFFVRFDAQGEMAAQTQMYERPDCAKATLLAEITGDYRLAASADAGTPIDYTIRSIALTLQAAEVVDAYNGAASNRCAANAWRLNEPQSVLGGYCLPTQMPAGGTVYSDAAFIEGDSVRFGLLPMGLSATPSGARPSAPSAIVFAKAHEAP